MANPEHLNILKQGPEAWNRWRKQNPKVQPDLRAARLVSAQLSGCILSQANLAKANLKSAAMVAIDLREADLTGADLEGADLSFKLVDSAGPRFEFTWAQTKSADLSWADLSDANLRGVDFLGARLMHTKLCGADLTGANLSNVHLQGADFTEALVRDTAFDTATFGGTQLRAIREFHRCRFLGPSFLDQRTISKSWPLPVGFLRGCGLPDDVIKRLPELITTKYNSSFISYSHQDEEFAKRLYANLQGAGARCWFAPEDMKIGDRIRDTIEGAIRGHSKLLLILSETSVASKWVEKEVETAFDKETDEYTVLVPIRLDDAVMESAKTWAADIRRTRHIGDFTHWKDEEAYQKAFERLLRDLKMQPHRKE